MYKLYKDPITGQTGLTIIRTPDDAFIPVAPDNTDYANFKAQINADEAQLEDAEGNLMTAEQAKEFVSTLP